MLATAPAARQARHFPVNCATQHQTFHLTTLIVLSIRNLSKSFSSAGEPIHVLRGVNLDVEAGERVALTGESGSGKSTLLHLIAGLDAADGGAIRLEGTEVTILSDAGRAALRRDRLGRSSSNST